jgi:hypothetical protein
VFIIGITIVQEIWDGIRFIINFFVEKVPTPIKFLIFLLFLLFFGATVSFILHLSGIHCNSAKEVVKTNWLDVGTNIALIWEDSSRTFTEDNLSICDVHPEYCGNENECYFYAQQLDNGLYASCNLTNASSECKYYLKEGTCHNCTEQEICFQESMFWIFCGNWHSVCIDNAYSTETNFRDTLTGCGSACFVPQHYLWNISTGQYECADTDYCGAGATIEQDPIIDEKLKRANAERVYATKDSHKSYTSLVLLKCNNNFNPRLTFFGVDVFDYRFWLLMAVVWVMAMFLFKLNK